MATFSSRNYSPECRQVLPISSQLQELRGNDLGRGLEVDHSTINRWVLDYAPEPDRHCRPHLQSTNDSWRVDETYVKVKQKWKYLDRAVDSKGNTIDFLLTARRDTEAAQRFLSEALKATLVQKPRVIKVAKNPSYPPAVEQRESSILPEDTKTQAG